MELLPSSVTLSPDLMEFERCEQLRGGLAHSWSSCGGGDRGSGWGALQALSHGSSRTCTQLGLGDGVGGRAKEIVLKLRWHSTYTELLRLGVYLRCLGGWLVGIVKDKAPPTLPQSLFWAAL